MLEGFLWLFSGGGLSHIFFDFFGLSVYFIDEKAAMSKLYIFFPIFHQLSMFFLTTRIYIYICAHLVYSDLLVEEKYRRPL